MYPIPALPAPYQPYLRPTNLSYNKSHTDTVERWYLGGDKAHVQTLLLLNHKRLCKSTAYCIK